MRLLRSARVPAAPKPGQEFVRVEVTIRVPAGPERVGVLGSADRNLKMIREALGVRLTPREHHLHVAGDPEAVQVARGVIDRLTHAARQNRGLTRSEVLDMIADESARIRENLNRLPSEATRTLGHTVTWEGDLDVIAAGRRVGPRTDNQRDYIETIRSNDLTFGLGPAGTGKTYLAVAAAVHLLKHDRVKKVVLARPAVEAGEKLGFLPGTLEAKVNPYLRPLLDALHDMIDYPSLRRFVDSDIIEIAPLAFMRGRTLNSAVVLLDEAQNTTRAQMQMFLTRMGHGSKMIVTGDVTQIDLPDPTQSGLIDAARRLARVEGVGMVYLNQNDVVRHRLVQRIIEAYGDTPTAEPR